MESVPISGIRVFYDLDDRQVIDEIVIACERSIQTISNLWKLDVPQDCRVYIMTAWPGCVFQGAPIGSQILLGLTLPLWYSEFKKRWQYAGGWSQRYGSRNVVGIKTPQLIAKTHASFGESIFIPPDTPQEKIHSILAHELTHAFSSHLGLPAWLNEGIAMVSSDHCLGKATVLPNTLQQLNDQDQPNATAETINLNQQKRDEIILLYIRGYWLTRFLCDFHPKLLNELLMGGYSHREIEDFVSARLELTPGAFWQRAGQLVVTNYQMDLT